MPSMPRTDKKASRIAFDILGIPSEMQAQAVKAKRKSNKDNYDARLTFEETVRDRS